jgi:carbonic anhydrase
MRFGLFFLLPLFTSVCCAQVLPEKALKNLIDGNGRFIAGTSKCPDRTEERRLETAILQEPFAVIVGCSDSRVAPEIIFDQGIGDLFIVRVAGNVVGPLEQDSIDYSVIYLHSSVIIVLGHENCGAVKAVLSGTTKDIESVATLLQPAITASKQQEGNKLENAVKANARLMAKQISNNPVLRSYINQKKLLVKAGYYNFHTGQVEILP